jgi:hypothetical protein
MSGLVLRVGRYTCDPYIVPLGRLDSVVPSKFDAAAEHKQQRLDWCRTREHWDIEWNTIVFSDESHFCLGHHDSRHRVRRRRGEWRNFEFSVVRH